MTARASQRRRRISPFDDPIARFLAGRLGTWVFLASLAMLFGATLIGFAVIRSINYKEWPTDLPPLPAALWSSTVVLIFSSGTMQLALLAAQRDARGAIAAFMLASWLLGLSFLGVQAYAWFSWLAEISDWWDRSDVVRFALTSFYIMTMLHAVHVIGGLVPMTIVAIRAFAGRYSKEHHAGVHYTVLYWHFLGGVWIVLFATLKLGV